MSGPSWLIDSKRIASKIKNASDTADPRRIIWKSNPTRTCPKCNYIIDNSDVVQAWPGLPKGVKFDPSDQELLGHLLTKVGKGEAKPHPFINEFIPTVEEEDGICYTHPKKLPGVKQDGSIAHFFHRTFKAYNTGTRKRRKIQNDDGDVRWHKTGKTKPVIIDGEHLGCKKIMVLYIGRVKGKKPEKTNWVMHQYHLGIGEDEKDGEFVVSKVFYQTQTKPGEKISEDLPFEANEAITMEADPSSSPELMTFEPSEKLHPYDLCTREASEEMLVSNELEQGNENTISHSKNNDFEDNHPQTEDPKWWEGESQFLLDSQQLAEGLSICDEFLQSQNSYGIGDENRGRSKPRLSDYAHMGVEYLKKDLEECQKLPSSDPPNIEFDGVPEMRLSQLEFGSQDSFLAGL